MKIGLINLEPKIVNTALMQISQYHKQRGDSVSMFRKYWNPAIYRQFDNVYCSSLFDFTNKYQIPGGTICGGTGFGLDNRLSQEIEACDYDYSIYPECDYSIVWFSRGCNNNCPFCVVPKKEGKIHSVIPKALNPNGKYIMVQDNSFFDNPDWKEAIEILLSIGQKVEITNVNVRTLDDEKCKAITKLKHISQIKIAWDNPRQDITDHLNLLMEYVKPYRIGCYVLIGYWSTPEEDLYRVEKLREMKIDPYAMPYDKKDSYQRKFARWVNMKSTFKTVKWSDYTNRKRLSLSLSLSRKQRSLFND